MRNLPYEILPTVMLFTNIAMVFALMAKLSLLVFYVTCNNISVIYVTAQMCRRTEEEVVVPTVGLPTP